LPQISRASDSALKVVDQLDIPSIKIQGFLQVLHQHHAGNRNLVVFIEGDHAGMPLAWAEKDVNGWGLGEEG
jgi:hypothetical protein